MIDLGGKVALVTGGSRGIGAACSELLAQAGARLAVNYRVDAAAARAVVERISSAGGEALALAADVSRGDEARRLVAATLDEFGRLDILVNNAGIWKGGAVECIADHEWAEMIDVNLSGTFHVIRAAVPHMKAGGGGRIVTISSTAGQRGEAGHCHYAATKGAIISLTKSLAAELAGDGILTNCVAPGWVETDMTHAALRGAEGARIREAIPLGRAGHPKEIAGAVLFLVSDLSGFVNGEILNVNGGAVLCG